MSNWAPLAPPVNARELLSHVAEKWQDYPRRREVAINAVSKFLDYAIEVHGLPAESWTVTARVAKQMKGTKPKRRIVATPTDAELIRLIDSLPNDVRCQRWKNALRLMALYGLRPEELNHLVCKRASLHKPTGAVLYLREGLWLQPRPIRVG